MKASFLSALLLLAGVLPSGCVTPVLRWEDREAVEVDRIVRDALPIGAPVSKAVRLFEKNGMDWKETPSEQGAPSGLLASHKTSHGLMLFISVHLDARRKVTHVDVILSYTNKPPNKAPEPTPGSVTLRAPSRVIESKQLIAVPNLARSAPAPVVAHL